MSKRKIFVAALAVCLIAILSMGSLAWFNATDKVTNTFMFDDTDGDGTPDFKVNVFESNDPEEDGNQYTHIAPNSVLTKDPTVKNEGDYTMYTRLVVTLSDSAAWVSAAAKYDLTADGEENTILEKMVEIDPNWIRYDNPVRDIDGDTIQYVYYYNGTVAKGAVTQPLFTTVTIPEELQTEDMTFGDDAFTIDVKADAVQSDNIPVDTVVVDANNAYKAFSYVNWAAGTAYTEPNA